MTSTASGARARERPRAGQRPRAHAARAGDLWPAGRAGRQLQRRRRPPHPRLVPAAACGGCLPLACRVTFIGYGGGRDLPTEHSLYAACGYAALIMDSRSQGGSWSSGDTPDPGAGDSGSEHPGVMTRGIASPETYYYRRMYVDAVRAVETAAACPASIASASPWPARARAAPSRLRRPRWCRSSCALPCGRAVPVRHRARDRDHARRALHRARRPTSRCTPEMEAPARARCATSTTPCWRRGSARRRSSPSA